MKALLTTITNTRVTQLASITARQSGRNHAAPLPLTTHCETQCDFERPSHTSLKQWCKAIASLKRTLKGPQACKGQRMTHSEWTTDGVTKTIIYTSHHENVSLPGTVHRLSGPDMFALTRGAVCVVCNVCVVVWVCEYVQCVGVCWCVCVGVRCCVWLRVR